MCPRSVRSQHIPACCCTHQCMTRCTAPPCPCLTPNAVPLPFCCRCCQKHPIQLPQAPEHSQRCLYSRIWLQHWRVVTQQETTAGATEPFDAHLVPTPFSRTESLDEGVGDGVGELPPERHVLSPPPDHVSKSLNQMYWFWLGANSETELPPA